MSAEKNVKTLLENWKKALKYNCCKFTEESVGERILKIG